MTDDGIRDDVVEDLVVEIIIAISNYERRESTTVVAQEIESSLIRSLFTMAEQPNPNISTLERIKIYADALNAGAAMFHEWVNRPRIRLAWSKARETKQ